MIKNLFTNWKTSSAGVTMIALAIVHLIYEIIQGSANETTWTRAITATVGGCGLIFAGDAAAGQKRTDDLKEDVKTAMNTGDTSILDKKPEEPTTKGTP